MIVYNRVMNSKNVGESSEAQVLAAFLKAGKIVLMPFGDNQRYDLVVDEAGRFIRIQVKTLRRLKSGSLSFNVCSLTTENGKTKHVPYHGQIDYFAAYWREGDKIFIIPVEETGKRGFSLRETLANGGPGTNLMEKYLFRPISSFSRTTS